jgi:peptidoglycan/LPS O-acetylase OafA/YrhL
VASFVVERVVASPSDTRAGHPFLANLKKREIPSLYGLRGIAALVVVCFHLLYAMQLSNWQRVFPGDEAVALFFELSGLLITWLLLKERSNTGSIHLKKFYQRRALRLFPAFYVIWLLCLLIHPVPGRWWSFFYMRDLYALAPLTAGAEIFGMAWSLGVEEKFYLVWPWFCRRFRSRRLPLLLIGLGLLINSIAS